MFTRELPCLPVNERELGTPQNDGMCMKHIHALQHENSQTVAFTTAYRGIIGEWVQKCIIACFMSPLGSIAQETSCGCMIVLLIPAAFFRTIGCVAVNMAAPEPEFEVFLAKARARRARCMDPCPKLERGRTLQLGEPCWHVCHMCTHTARL